MDSINSIEENPLLLPPVYASIFENLKSKELLHLRGVCPAWNDFIQEVLGKRQDLLLSVGWDSDLKLLQFLKENPDPFLPSFIKIKIPQRPGQLMRVCELIGRLECIKSVNLQKHNNVKIVPSDLVLKILQNFSSSVESLKMWMDQWIDPPAQTFQENRKLLAGLCLSRLKDLCILIPEEAMEAYKNLIKVILTAAPNLQKLSKGNEPIVIPVLQDCSRLEQIQHLDIQDATEENLRILLGAENLRLRSLAIREFNLEVYPIMGDIIEKLLEKQKSTLTSILFNGSGSEMRYFKFPTLPNLKELDLSTDLSNFAMNVDFSRDMPNLQKMALDSVHLSGTTGVCKSVWNLELDFCDSGENVENFGRLFPSLKKLYLKNCSPDFLPVVWRSCKNLEDLRLETYSASWDFLLFGITDEWKAEVDTTQPNWWEGVNPPQEESSLANLKDLQKFKIDSYRSLITDFSAYFGFRKMKGLKMLEFHIREHNEISSQARNFLMKELPFLKSIDSHGRHH